MGRGIYSHYFGLDSVDKSVDSPQVPVHLHPKKFSILFSDVSFEPWQQGNHNDGQKWILSRDGLDNGLENGATDFVLHDFFLVSVSSVGNEELVFYIDKMLCVQDDLKVSFLNRVLGVTLQPNGPVAGRSERLDHHLFIYYIDYPLLQYLHEVRLVDIFLFHNDFIEWLHLHILRIILHFLLFVLVDQMVPLVLDRIHATVLLLEVYYLLILVEVLHLVSPDQLMSQVSLLFIVLVVVLGPEYFLRVFSPDDLVFGGPPLVFDQILVFRLLQ